MRTLLLLLSLFVAGLPLTAQSVTYSNDRTFASENVVRFDLMPFPHGVASGDPLADRVIIWTRVSPDSLTTETVNINWRVATDPTLENVVRTGVFPTSAERDYTVKVDVTGLESATTYYYGFSLNGQNSLTGKTKTTPGADEADHLKFGVVSCSNYQAGYFNAYGRLADRTDLDAIVHLGDYIYEYGNREYGADSLFAERAVAPPTEIVSLFDYRTRYSTYRLDTNLIRAHQQHPFIAVWDDHESANDAYEDGAENHQPATEGDWSERKRRARQAYFEWMPIRDTGRPQTGSIYRTIPYGNLADLIMIDTRLEGRDEQVSSVLDSVLLDPNRTLLGQTQKAWFLEQLSNSEAKWKIIGNQVIFSEFNVGWGGAAVGQTFAETESLFLDIWDGYPAERRQVTTFLREQDIDNVVFLTGDFHSSFAFEVADPPVNLSFQEIPGVGTLPVYSAAEGYNPATGAGAVAIEFATPSISAANFDENTSAETSAGLELQINQPIAAAPGLSLGNPNPHMKYADLDRHGYFVLDVRPDGVQADYFYGPVLEPSTTESFGAGWRSEADTAHLRTAPAPATAKEIQDQPAPADPPAMSTSADRAPLARVLSLFPNPAGEEVRFQYALPQSTRIHLNLLDANGKTIRAGRSLQQPAGVYTQRVPVGQLPAGLYFLQLVTQRGQTVQSFVKE